MKTTAPRMLLVLCSCPDTDTADALAAKAIEQRQAACASILPGMRSVYRWKGEIERADEVLLLLKTTPAHFDSLRDLLLAGHPYELPEIIAVEPDAGLPAYLDWVAAETTPPADVSPPASRKQDDPA